ncbi:MAG: HD domain-containing protein [Desulfobacteraceae bacterium]|nr:HD domain-containing protein [Desulfobacteraceae bacterium]
MVAKTQVVLINQSDHSSTRLTHSLEVGQIAESIATQMGLNTFAILAMALGHDVGHTPFGHTGERTLSAILTDHGLDPFKHNYQSILVVNTLEKRYKKSDGLNLMWETRDGILKHTHLMPDINLEYYDSQLNKTHYPATLEGQIVRIVDEIAQRAHVTEECLRTDIINIKELTKKEIVKKSLIENGLSVGDIVENFSTDKGSLTSKCITSTLITCMIKYYVLHTIENAFKNLEKMDIKTYDDVLNSKDLIIDWDEKFQNDDDSFAKDFLSPRFYEHDEIIRMDDKTEYFLKKLFKAFKQQPKQLPKDTYNLFVQTVKQYLHSVAKVDEDSRISSEIKSFLEKEKIPCEDTCSFLGKSKNPNNHQMNASTCPLQRNGKNACQGIRVIINHIAGMADRYARLEYARLYFPSEAHDFSLQETHSTFYNKML